MPGPLISGSIPVIQDQLYTVKVELMLTDLDGDDEYADITLNGISFGQCNPSGGQQSCTWHICSALTQSIIQTSTSSISVYIQYSDEVDDFPCEVDGRNAPAIARVTLIPAG